MSVPSSTSADHCLRRDSRVEPRRTRVRPRPDQNRAVRPHGRSIVTTVNTAFTTRPSLPALPLEEWEQTKETLHLWVQIVGKIRMASTPPRNHWWHVPLYVDVRGSRRGDSTRRTGRASRSSSTSSITARRSDEPRRAESFALVDGLSVAAFDEQLHATLARAWRRRRDSRDAVRRADDDAVPGGRRARLLRPRRGRALLADPRLDRRGARGVRRLVLRQDEPVHLFWHSLDLAVTRFGGGARRPHRLAARSTGRRTRTKVVSFGFWAGDQNVREPTYYAYAAPEPAGLREQPLRPARRTGSNEPADRSRSCPTRQCAPPAIRGGTLLAFLESAYQAGAALGGWDRRELASTWCPPPSELHDLVGG